MYAIYHGPVGLTRIAKKVHLFTQLLHGSVERLGFKVVNDAYFDTLTIDVSPVCKNAEVVHAAAALKFVNLRRVDSTHVGITLDESVGHEDLKTLVSIFATAGSGTTGVLASISQSTASAIPSLLVRTSEFLPHPVFNTHHSETEMLRYIFHLASKDLSLVHTMIPLGSCTMKLNSTSSMIPLTWPEFAGVHPFAPVDQVEGYRQIIKVFFFNLVGVVRETHNVRRNWKQTSARLPDSTPALYSPIQVPLVNTLV